VDAGERGGGASVTYNHLSEHGRARATPAYAAPGETPSSSSLTVAYYADPYAEDEDGQGATAVRQRPPAEYAEARPMSVSMA